MRSIKLFTATALCAQALAFAGTPAMAGTTVSGTVASQADLTASCQQYLHADVNGGFMAEAINAAQVDTEVENSESPHVVTYSGEPVLGGVELVSTSKNSGVDAQVFGDSFYTRQTYASGTESWTTTVVVESHFTYDCKIYKLTRNGKEVIPTDKQRPGQTSSSWTTTTVTDHLITIPSVTVTLDQPVFADRAPICRLVKVRTGNGRDAVVTEEWQAVGGYAGALGECSQDLYDDAAVFGGGA